MLFRGWSTLSNLVNLNAWHGRLKIWVDLFVDGREVWSFCILARQFQGHDQSLLRHFHELPIRGIHTEAEKQQIPVHAVRHCYISACARSLLSALCRWTYSWTEGGQEWRRRGREEKRFIIEHDIHFCTSLKHKTPKPEDSLPWHFKS